MINCSLACFICSLSAPIVLYQLAVLPTMSLIARYVAIDVEKPVRCEAPVIRRICTNFRVPEKFVNRYEWVVRDKKVQLIPRVVSITK
uniref:Uncharacterized protein n=1 Tax=Anguilla anguilla TaxID=7936 RepID=A0A0E9R6G0_ANGAN